LNLAAVRLVFACLLACGCQSREAREDRAVQDAIDVLRDSPPDDLITRRARIDALQKLPATTPLARDARDACSEAYLLVVEGKQATSKLKAEMERLGAPPKNALADLALAEEKIKKSEPAMRACQKAAIELGVRRR